MHWNTRLDNFFRWTRRTFSHSFVQTRAIPHFFKHPEEPFYLEKCPPAILHVRDIWHSINYKRDGILKTALRGLALLLAVVLELSVLLVKSLMVDIISLPLAAVGSFVTDLVELATNIVSDVASLPAAMVDGLADRVPGGKHSTIEEYENRSTESPRQTWDEDDLVDEPVWSEHAAPEAPKEQPSFLRPLFKPKKK